MISAKIIEDSITAAGSRLVTMQLCYPRFIHAEYLTHRAFSRNASSSRAIPVSKMLEMVRNNPATPIHWGKNQPGMQANEQLTGADLKFAKDTWMYAASSAAAFAKDMHEVGLHKQVANRILEPFQWIHVVVTATEWDNFFALRDHPDAQPEIHELAIQMRKAMNDSEPTLLMPGEWHLPYVTKDERSDGLFKFSANKLMLPKISAARCARVSYLKHDGAIPNVNEDLALYERLVGGVPMHASPIEHQATPDLSERWSGNFKGWKQYRKLVEAATKSVKEYANEHPSKNS